MVWVGTSLPTRRTHGVVFQWVSAKEDWPQVELGSSAYTPTPPYTTLFRYQAIELGKPHSSHDKTKTLSIMP